MNVIRIVFWVLAGACFFVGMVSSLFFVLLPASVLLGIGGAIVPRRNSSPGWFTLAAAGAGISSLALFAVNPDVPFFLITGLVLLAISAISLAVGRRNPSRT